MAERSSSEVRMIGLRALAIVVTIRSLLRRNLWFLGTGTTAGVVFLVTFLAVSAATEEDFIEPATIVQPTTPGSQAAADDQAAVTTVEEEEEEVEEEEEAEAQVVEETAAEQATDAEAEESDETVVAIAEQAEPRLREVDLPEFDEDDLIHGGDGRAGAILAGPGIVPSSGASRSTDWELLIPSARIRASLVKVGLARGNAFGAPDNPDVIGWWENGPQPGQPGNVLLDGHRDFSDIDDNLGTGVCWSLPQTVAGDVMIIRDSAAGLHYIYEVTETLSVRWNDADAVRFLQPSQDSILTLITCEGSFDDEAHNYSNRRIVVASLIGQAAFELPEASPSGS